MTDGTTSFGCLHKILSIAYQNLVKMKLRIKSVLLNRPCLIQLESENASVLDLKDMVVKTLNLENETLKSSMNFSFNGKDLIETSDDQSLSSLGFVSGDVVYVTGIPAPTEKQEIKHKNPCNSIADTGSCKISKLDVYDYQNGSNMFLANNPVMKLGRLPLPLCETPDFQIPQSFSNLLAANTDKFNSPFENFCGLLHVLTVETGFTPDTHISGNPYTSLPDSWKLQHETLKLSYCSSLSPFGKSTLVITAVGPLAIVYGLSSSEKTLTLKLKPSDYLWTEGCQKLSKLSITFKDSISFPLLTNIQRETNGKSPTNLSTIPPEIFWKILKQLDVQSLCRLAITCSSFQSLANQPAIWKILIKRDFGRTSDQDDNCKNIYKEEHNNKKRQNRRSQPLFNHPMRPFNPPGPYLPENPFNPGNRLPGIIGGDHDLFPNLGGIIAPPNFLNPRNRGPNFSNPFGLPRGGFPFM